MKIKRKCIFTGENHVLDLPVTQEQITNYMNGMLLQNAFPNLSPEERDFIKFGVPPKQWDRHVGRYQDDGVAYED